jgi:nitrogen fixation protein FixH
MEKMPTCDRHVVTMLTFFFNKVVTQLHEIFTQLDTRSWSGSTGIEA